MVRQQDVSWRMYHMNGNSNFWRKSLSCSISIRNLQSPWKYQYSIASLTVILKELIWFVSCRYIHQWEEYFSALTLPRTGCEDWGWHTDHWGWSGGVEWLLPKTSRWDWGHSRGGLQVTLKECIRAVSLMEYLFS